MSFTTSNVVLAASALLLWAPSRVTAITYNSTTYVNCYSSLPDFVDNGTYTWQSAGYCQERCVPLGYPVMALKGGNDCYCGSELPSKSDITDSCDQGCDGWQEDKCGGTSAYDVYLTGMTSSVPSAGSQSTSSTTSTSSSSTTSSGSITVITQAGQTIIVTQSSTPTASSKSSGNTAGIAAGVVVGVVALAGIIGGAIFFLRRREKKRVESEYRRNAEINAFTQKPNSVSSDSRWNSDFMAQRRQSNGSIADDQDFSRRILQVTNPDR